MAYCLIWKISGVLNGIRTLDLCDAGAVLEPTELNSSMSLSKDSPADPKVRGL